ncbi:putative calcium-binding outer membrane-like protein [Nonlabens ulvanivorans]|nr:Calx-beta domain-containing protein [Nonlabens ulvanivorans]GAK93583.1 putative calcium-binding outer membrane-like protein [Nonlabens ulvanivorans]
MKVLRLFLLCLFAFNYSYSQVGIGTETPDPAAILDVRSEISPGVYGGLKLPTLTLAQRATITAPIPDGLMIYLSDGNNRCLQVYDGTRSQWMDWYCMNELPEASLVDFTGTLEVDETLTSSYTYTDGENDTESGTSYQWYRADDATGTNVMAISGATAATYLTTTSDGNFYVAVGVTPRASSGASPGIEVLSPYREIEFKQTEIEFAIASSTIPEDDVRTININVLNPSPTVATTVEVNLNAASTVGVLGTDYDIDNNSVAVTTFPFTMTIPAGATTASFDVYVYADDNNAVDEMLQLDLQNPSGGINTIIGTVNSHSVTFIDDDSATEVAFDSITYSEVENGLVGSIDINIINPSAITATTVEVALNASSTAINGVDYDTDGLGTALNFPITITFPANTSASQQIDFFITNDLISEGNETIILDLQNISGGVSAVIGTNTSTTFTIVDDEVPLYYINEDFDTDGNGSRYSTSRTESVSSNMTDYFSRTDGLNIDVTFNNVDGSYFATQDIDGLGGSQAQQLVFNNLNLSGSTTFNYSIDLAEDDDGSSQDWDAADYFRIQYSLDSGAWVTVFEVRGSGTNTEPRVTQNAGGTPLGTFVTDSFQTFTGSFVAAPTSTIEFRLAFSMDAGDEDIAVDNFIVD